MGKRAGESPCFSYQKNALWVLLFLKAEEEPEGPEIDSTPDSLWKE